METVIRCLDADITELAYAVQQSRRERLSPGLVEINRPPFAHSKGRVKNPESLRACKPYTYNTQLGDEVFGSALAKTEA